MIVEGVCFNALFSGTKSAFIRSSMKHTDVAPFESFGCSLQQVNERHAGHHCLLKSLCETMAESFFKGNSIGRTGGRRTDPPHCDIHNMLRSANCGSCMIKYHRGRP